MESTRASVKSERWSWRPTTALPGGAAASQGCAMDGGASPEPQAFAATFHDPWPGPFLPCCWDPSINGQVVSTFVERCSELAVRPG